MFCPPSGVLYFSFNGFKVCPFSAACGRVADATFLATFFVHRLRCLFVLFFNGFEVAVSDPYGRVANTWFLGLSELGFRWCLAFSHALPMSLIFVFVQAGLRYVFCPAVALPSCVFERFRSGRFGPVWKGCERRVFGLI